MHRLPQDHLLEVENVSKMTGVCSYWTVKPLGIEMMSNNELVRKLAKNAVRLGICKTNVEFPSTTFRQTVPELLQEYEMRRTAPVSFCPSMTITCPPMICLPYVSAASFSCRRNEGAKQLSREIACLKDSLLAKQTELQLLSNAEGDTMVGSDANAAVSSDDEIPQPSREKRARLATEPEQ